MTENRERRNDIPGFRWIFCNTCGKTATAGATLYVSGCGHTHCSTCLNAIVSAGATSSKGPPSSLQCSRCKKPMKLQKIDRNLPANVTSYFLNPQDVMKSALKSVMPIVQFQENQCRLLNKRIAETRCRNQQLRSYCLQMVKMKSQLEKELAARTLRSENERKHVTSKTPSRSSGSSVANPSTAVYYRAQQEQSDTPSALTNGSEASGCSRGSLSVSQNFISTVNTSLVSAMNNMLNNKKSSIHGHQDILTAGKSQGESSNLRDAFLPKSSHSGGDQGPTPLSAKLTQQSVSAPRKRDHSGNIPRGAKTAPLRKMPQHHDF